MATTVLLTAKLFISHLIFINWICAVFACFIMWRQMAVVCSASKSCIRRYVITEKAPTRAFSWLKAATTAFTFKTDTMLNWHMQENSQFTLTGPLNQGTRDILELGQNWSGASKIHFPQMNRMQLPFGCVQSNIRRCFDCGVITHRARTKNAALWKHVGWMLQRQDIRHRGQKLIKESG